MRHTVTDVRTGKHFSRNRHAYLLVTTAHCQSKQALLFCTWGHTVTGVRRGKMPYCSAHGALVAVVPSPEKAVPAEGVAAGGGHRLVQQLQTQYTLELIHPLCHSWPVAPRLYSVDRSDVKQRRVCSTVTATGWRWVTQCVLAMVNSQHYAYEVTMQAPLVLKHVLVTMPSTLTVAAAWDALSQIKL